MLENIKIILQTKKALFLSIVIILLIILAGFFVYQHFFSNKTHSYLIEKSYYSFKLKAPVGWTAQENTLYSEDNVNQILTKCKADESKSASVYEIGAYKFESQKYPQNFSAAESFAFSTPSGAILEITVNCVPDNIKDSIGNYSGNLRVAGEPAQKQSLDLPTFQEVDRISFLHNNFQYIITEYVYISSGDKNNSKKITGSYAKILDKIVSSLEFTR